MNMNIQDTLNNYIQALTELEVAKVKVEQLKQEILQQAGPEVTQAPGVHSFEGFKVKVPVTYKVGNMKLALSDKRLDGLQEVILPIKREFSKSSFNAISETHPQYVAVQAWYNKHVTESLGKPAIVIG